MNLYSHYKFLKPFSFHAKLSAIPSFNELRLHVANLIFVGI